MKYWIDGCFDFFHHGHANVLFQSKTITNDKSFLEIGIHSDEEITLNKGPPVMTLKERIASTDANKWCNSIYASAPYVTSLELIKSENCDFVIHGDDITTDKDGNDCYQAIKDAGMMKLVSRTGGVSTTELIGRLLNNDFVKENDIEEVLKDDLIKDFSKGPDGFTPFNNIWYLESGSSLKELQIVDPVDLDGAVYIHGSFDLFNPFHVTALESFKDKVIVIGIYQNGESIMNLLQRSLCVLQCKYAKNVIIGVDPSFKVGKEQIDIESFDNEFSYLKENGIKKRIEENLEKYHDRQRKKGVKSELEVQMG